MKPQITIPLNLLACAGIFVIFTVSGMAGETAELPAKAPVTDTLEQTDKRWQWGPIVVDPGYSREIVNWQQNVTEKPYLILNYEKEGRIAPNTLTVSGALWGSWMHEKTNVPGKFPILSRFPDQHGSTDSKADRWILNNAAITLTGRLGSWVTLFAQGEYSDIEFIGQDQYQLRKYLVMVGNLEKFPFYAYFGRTTVDFGSMDAYTPFTHSVNNHSYRVDSDDPVIALGYAPSYLEGLNIVATAIPGGRHLRVANTNGSGQFDNFAINGSYRKTLNEDLALKVGAGWLNSTIYNTDIPHHPGPAHAFSLANSTEEIENGAWDVNAEISWRQFRVMGEYTSSAEAWPSTGRKVSSITGQAAYDFELLGRDSILSFVYGKNQQGPDGTEYEQLKQIAVGFEMQVCENFSLGIEYVRNSAFVPLIAITQASDSDVRTDTVIIGGKFSF